MPSILNINGKIHLHNVNYNALTESDKLTLGFAKHNYSFLNGINSHVDFKTWIDNIVNYTSLNKVTLRVLAVLRKCIDVAQCKIKLFYKIFKKVVALNFQCANIQQSKVNKLIKRGSIMNIATIKQKANGTWVVVLENGKTFSGINKQDVIDFAYEWVENNNQ